MAAAAASSGSSPPPMHGASLATSRALRMGRSTSRVASTAAHWVALANQAGADESGDRVIVQFVGGSDEGDVGQGTQSDALREDLSRLVLRPSGGDQGACAGVSDLIYSHG